MYSDEAIKIFCIKSLADKAKSFTISYFVYVHLHVFIFVYSLVKNALSHVGYLIAISRFYIG